MYNARTATALGALLTTSDIQPLCGGPSLLLRHNSCRLTGVGRLAPPREKTMESHTLTALVLICGKAKSDARPRTTNCNWMLLRRALHRPRVLRRSLHLTTPSLHLTTPSLHPTTPSLHPTTPHYNPLLTSHYSLTNIDAADVVAAAA